MDNESKAKIKVQLTHHDEQLQQRRFVWLWTFFWTVALIILLSWNLFQIKQEVLWAINRNHIITTIGGYSLLWLLGIFGIGLGARRAKRGIQDRIRAEENRDAALKKLEKYSEQLAEMVEERTQELRLAQEQLIRNEKLATMGQLAGSVAHELRNPLGVLSNAAYFLTITLTDADEKTQEYLGIIDSEVRKSQKIVSDLLSFSRVQKTQNIQREDVLVTSLVHRALTEQPAPTTIEVSTEFSQNLPPVYVDPQQIQQVLANLVSNAYQAMPDGGKLIIKTEVERDQVALSVIDNGTGISPENIDKLFEPLFTTKPKGIGLGLAVSKDLVEANGGSIEVKSDDGGGCTFTVWLPVNAPNNSAEERLDYHDS
jgi:signal transduction histidine kinase